MTEQLSIGTAAGEQFVLPRDAVTQKNAFLGRTGSGKSYAAMKLAEEMLDIGAQVVVLDVVGVWWGLRLAEDGESPGIDTPIFGGLRGDIPLEPTAGALVADLLVERRQSVILDLSQFESDKQKSAFAAAFGDRFFRRMKAAPSAVHVFLEECQEIVPQNLQKGEEMMLHYWTRLAKLGRNFGIGVSLISQRPQEVNKKVLNMSEVLFAFQMRGKEERQTVKDWNDHLDTGKGGDIVKLLPTLARGHAHVSSPQWLEFDGVVEIGKKWTYDSSSTPVFGAEDAGRAPAHDLAPLDLGALQQAMAATVEEHKANDPKELKKQIAVLEREVEALQAADRYDSDATAGLTSAAIREQLARRDDDWKAVIALADGQHASRLAQAIRELDNIRTIEVAARGVIEGVIGVLKKAPPDAVAVGPIERTEPAARKRFTPPVVIPPRTQKTPRTNETRASTNGDLGGGPLKILGSLAQLEAIGLQSGRREIVAWLAGYTASGGGFRNYLGSLRSQGYIEYPNDNLVALTTAGRKAAPGVDRPASRRQLHDQVLNLLDAPLARILGTLLQAYPRAISRAELASSTGYEPTGGGFRNYLGKLRTLGAIEYPSDGVVKAAELLYPKGLR